LSEDGVQVVLVEAGPRDWHPMIHVPAGALHLRTNPLVDRSYYAKTRGRASLLSTPRNLHFV
jgi:choline dehydrogenase-like flavoprotein